MKLFLLIIDYGYDGIENIGIFSTYDKAQQEALRLEMSNRLNGGSTEIDEFDLDESYQ